MSNECIYEHRICRTHREQLRKKKKKNRIRNSSQQNEKKPNTFKIVYISYIRKCESFRAHNNHLHIHIIHVIITFNIN